MAYDGVDRIAEYDGSNALQRRYVHGPGVDQPLAWYEGTGTGDRRFMSSDESRSIISLTDSSGALLGINKYDEYGNPQAGNLGSFGYTGQAWLPSMAMWYYKARAYDPELGRFPQTDPIGYEGGINLYAYVLNDPVNGIDPFGFGKVCVAPTGSHIRDHCVSVDGDGDGETDDDDLTFGQQQRIAGQFGSFILMYGSANGTNLSIFGKPVSGDASAAELTSVRVASQFVGFALAAQFSAYYRQWQQIERIEAHPGFSAIESTIARITGNPPASGISTPSLKVITFSGASGQYFVSNLYNSYSDLAKSIIHEVLHRLKVFSSHERQDYYARRALIKSGLADGGCAPIGGFPGC